MRDYTQEAGRYDETRGGDARADAAAAAIESLLPDGARVIADLGCGTGIVTARLAAPDRTVLGLDRAAGMLAVAATRLDRTVRADVTRLPLRDASCDAVIAIWVLHLVGPEAAAQVIAEAARVLRPGGRLIVTVDKDDANYANGSDIAAVIEPLRARHYPPQSDAADRVARIASGHGLRLAGQARFVGHGQGRSPRIWHDHLPNHAWVTAIDPAELDPIRAGLAALPDQDTARADPVYDLVALAR
ncbi:class I SAM-dependent methyltransferase [Catellatospora methionotrophica]|uniref:class I SAM-dependent methyltransferase n=1 Tax=Catellatospora methionotrophica TaxID=121620 RepID=UPI00340C2F10